MGITKEKHHKTRKLVIDLSRWQVDFTVYFCLKTSESWKGGPHINKWPLTRNIMGSKPNIKGCVGPIHPPHKGWWFPFHSYTGIVPKIPEWLFGGIACFLMFLQCNSVWGGHMWASVRDILAMYELLGVWGWLKLSMVGLYMSWGWGSIRIWGGGLYTWAAKWLDSSE